MYLYLIQVVWTDGLIALDIVSLLFCYEYIHYIGRLYELKSDLYTPDVFQSQIVGQNVPPPSKKAASAGSQIAA